jgi:DNA-binding transcriptional MerR regulator/quercetin dioxygenase-like cupin family protein
VAPQLRTVGQVARLLGVSAASLRDWERRGLIAPERSANRYRLYSTDDVRQLKHILHLRRAKGVNASGILYLRRRDTEPRSVPQAPPIKVGEDLARLRRQLGMKLTEAASRGGLTPQRLASIERGVTTPSIASLQKLARAYRTTVLALFASQAHTRQLVRPPDRSVLTESGVRMELLAFGALQMQAMLFRVAPHATSGGSYQHDGEEFIYMLGGKFEIWLDEVEHYVLEPGDSLYFLSTRAHRWRAVGEEEAVLLWINSPPTF